MTDLDQSGNSWQKARTYLGPSLGWVDTQVGPSRVITSPGTYLVQPGDSTIFVNTAGSVTIQLPDVNLWVQEPAYQPATGFARLITIKDLGNAGSFPISIQAFGAQKIDGQAISLSINQAFQSISLLPTNDLTGWWRSDVSFITAGSGGGGGPITSVAAPFTTPGGVLNITLDPAALLIDGSNRLTLDSDLTAIAQLSGVNTIYYRSGTGVWSPVTMGGNMTFSGGVLNSAAGISDAPSDGTTYGRLNGAWAAAQPLNANLTSLAAASAVNVIYYRSSTNTWGPVTVGSGLTFTSGTLDAPVFTSSVKGEVPASGGGSVNFLRADGTWSAPPGASLAVGTTSISGGATGSFLYDNAGVLGERTGTQATATLDIFTSTLKGLAPSSGGGTTNFLRADGTWVAPPTGGAATSIGVGSTNITGGATGTFIYDNAGVIGERTPTQVTATLDLFTSTLKGLTPSSGGGTANFLRADGTWAAPPGGGNVSNVGTPTNGQLAQWTDATHIQGIASSSLGFAPLASPVFTGNPQAPTPATADNSISIATTAFVKAQGYMTGNQAITLSNDVTGSGTTSIATTIAGGVVTNAKLANVGTGILKGRLSAGTGSPEDLTGTQVTTLLDVFTSTLKGLAPSSGGGTANFLRADGTWAAPVQATINGMAGPAYTIQAGAGTGINITLPGGNTVQVNGGLFTTSAQGMVPASGGGTTNFLRADGTWTAPAGGGGASVTISDTAPASPSVGNLWFDSVAAQLYIRYDDGTSVQWTPTTNQTGNQTPLSTTQVFTTGSGTYSTPTNCRQIEVTLIGGGGGGAGVGGLGAAGNATTFGAGPLFSAGGGAGGSWAGSSNGAMGGAGGTVSGSGTPTWSVVGGAGTCGIVGYPTSGQMAMGGTGGNSTWGGGGQGSYSNASITGVGATNTGGGGGGGGNGSNNVTPGGGGGAGATVFVVINAPAATYAYAVGAGGTGGIAGSGNPGGAGGSGIVVVKEFY